MKKEEKMSNVMLLDFGDIFWDAHSLFASSVLESEIGISRSYARLIHYARLILDTVKIRK
jgi:hypothetical protein